MCSSLVLFCPVLPCPARSCLVLPVLFQISEVSIGMEGEQFVLVEECRDPKSVYILVGKGYSTFPP